MGRPPGRVGGGSMQTLVEGLEGKRPAAFGLGSCAARNGAVDVVAAARGGLVVVVEGCANLHSYQNLEDLVGASGNEGLDGAREELGKGECLAGIATERGWLCGIEVGEDLLVEAQICPADEETKDGFEEGGDGHQRREGQRRDNTNVDKREPRYP